MSVPKVAFTVPVTSGDRKAGQNRVRCFPGHEAHDAALAGSVENRAPDDTGVSGVGAADRYGLALEIDVLVVGSRTDENRIAVAGVVDRLLDGGVITRHVQHRRLPGRKQKRNDQCRNDFSETWNGLGFVHSRQ
jgi:hypothetical protein